MNIKIRLSLLFTLAVEVLLVICFALLYLTIAADRRQDFAEQLRAKSLAVADVFFEAEELDKTALTLARQRFRSTLSSSQVIILDSLDRCIYINDSAYTTRSSLFQPITLDSTVYSFVSHAAISEARQRGFALRNEHEVYTVYLLHPDESNNYLIIVRAVDDAGAQLLSDVRFILIVSALLMPIAAFALGWWFARNALAPVAAMTQAATEISPENLNKRLPEGAGDDELVRLARSFNNMFERLERSYSTQRQFIAHASHELRTPLTIMEGEIGVALLQERPAEAYRTVLESVRKSIDRLNKLTSNLLLLATMEGSIPRQTMNAVYFDEILYNTLDITQAHYPERTLVVQDSLQEHTDSPTIVCYRELLQTALLNLLDNALKFSEPHQSVVVRVHTDDTALYCSVQDNGIGMNTDELRHAFSPFYRSERAHRMPGSGIGLALVKAIIELHKGKVILESTVGAGTTVTLHLPLA